ncbi:hypothetical protein BT96DRAFT_948752 [Gymnopus androsaceus JB14]|uniref:Uncharacterized protein n=1 Tax=Gymnopus androsaceus JB14 TaxID=1447944 RepID=A0A6A4GNA0_9AGAR|nr:hypothetical protein BT96DRAFT_948752 [Gymnopus androsaceus JB14]
MQKLGYITKNNIQWVQELPYIIFILGFHTVSESLISPHDFSTLYVCFPEYESKYRGCSAKDKNIQTGKPPTDIRCDLKVHESRMVRDLLWQGLGSDLTQSLAQQQKDHKLDFFEQAHKNKARVTMHATPTTVAPRDTTTQRQYMPQYVPYEYCPYQASLATTATAPVAAAAPVPFTMPTPSTSTAVSAPPPASHNGLFVATGDWSRDLAIHNCTENTLLHFNYMKLTFSLLICHWSKMGKVNEDWDKAHVLMCDLEQECSNLRNPILTLLEGDNASAKANIDCHCAELGHLQLPLLQSILDEKAAGLVVFPQPFHALSNRPSINPNYNNDSKMSSLSILRA